MPRSVALVLAGLATVALGVSAARAEETKFNPRSLLFEIGAPRADQRAIAYNEALRDAGPPPLTNSSLQPDGAVRYGNASTHVTVTVRNPCPPTDPGMMYDEPPLPGRRARAR